MQLSIPSSDLKELQKQNEMFRTLKADYDKSVKDLTKGQDVAQLEARARKALVEAKQEAASIVANAKRGVEQVEKSKGDYEALKAKLEQGKQSIEKAKADALKAKTEADKAKQEAENIRAELKLKCDECDKSKADLKSKVEELKTLLTRFNGSIN